MPPKGVEQDRQKDIAADKASKSGPAGGRGAGPTKEQIAGERAAAATRDPVGGSTGAGRESPSDSIRQVSTPAGTKTVNVSAAGTREGAVSYSAPTTADVRAQAAAAERLAQERAAEAARAAAERARRDRAVQTALSVGYDRGQVDPRLASAVGQGPSLPSPTDIAGALSRGIERAGAPAQRRTTAPLSFGSTELPSIPTPSIAAPLSFGEMPSPVELPELSLGQSLRFGVPGLSLPAIEAGIVAGEVPNALDPYNTLLNYSNEPGKPFADVRITDMTVQELLDFQRQRGPGSYAAYARGLPNVGRIATPAGKYQIVGDTLKSLVDKGYVDPNEKFTPEVQERLGRVLMEGRGLSAYMAGQMSEDQFLSNLGKEWQGFDPTVARGYTGTPETVMAPDGLPLSMGLGPTPGQRLAAASTPREADGIMGALGGLGGMRGTATYQNLPVEQQYAAQAAGQIIPGAGLMQSLGYALNDREMQAAARMLEGTYEPRRGIFGIGADPQFARAEPVYDERTGQLVGAVGYDAQGNPVMYRGQQQGVQYTGPGSEFLRGNDRQPGFSERGGAEPDAALTPAAPSPVPVPVSQTSIECPPGFRFDPATNSCQPETPWPTYRPPVDLAPPPAPGYTQVPQFTLPPLLPYPSGGIASI